MSNSIFTGSICLSDIPRELIKKVTCRDGKERSYLNIAVMAKRNPQTFTNNGVSRTYTHFVTCAPKKELRVEGVNYILGDMEEKMFGDNGQTAPQSFAPQSAQPSQTPMSQSNDLPF